MRNKVRSKVTINTSSTADIAFLLLVFFLVATTIVQYKGLSLQLPPEKKEDLRVKIKDRNLFKVLINSQDEFLIQNEVRTDLVGLRSEVKAFVLNESNSPFLAESSEKAIISLKTNRGTHYGKFIEVLDELKGAYYEVYAERADLSVTEFLSLDLTDEIESGIYRDSKNGLPMNISIAEPN
ncbi:MAG: biopolymer transporter ExbD [Bacteroidota bacterium]